MHISRYPIKIIGIILLLFSVTLIPVSAQAQEQSDTGAGQQARDVPALDVILLVDESETMWNTTDPEGVRVNTVNFFIDVLNSEQSGAGHRVAIIPFGTQPRVIPFTSLDDPAAAEELKNRYAGIHDEIEAVKDLQYTDINQALKLALTLLEQESSPTRKPGIILISDGQPTNPEVSEEKGRDVVEAYLVETQSLMEQLGQHQYQGDVCANTNGVPLYTIGMGVDNLQESSSPEFISLYREFWQGVASRSSGYYREAERLQEMQGISTYIFSELLCTPATPSQSFRESQVLEYQVYSSYYQIIFTISGKDNPDLEAQIYRPKADGSPGEALLAKDAEGVNWQSGPDYEVWRVRYTEPWAGTWRVTLNGEGQAEFSYVIFPNVTLNINEPNSGFLPVDSPLTLQAAITDENGQEVDVPVSDVQVEIEGEDFRRQVSLKKEGSNYVTQLAALDEPGEYSLTFSSILPDGTPLFEHKFVTLISAPWAQVSEPAQGATYLPGDSIPVETQVHLAGAVPLDGITVIASLLKEGRPVQTIELGRGNFVSQGQDENVVAYTGQFQPLDESGDYQVRSKLTAILPGGRVFDAQTPLLPLSVVPPPTPTPTATDTPTATPSPTLTPTPAAAAVVAPSPTATSPPPTPTPTPTPAPWYAPVTDPSNFPWLLLFLLLLVLLAAWAVLAYRNRQGVPDKIKMLATLMRSRRESGAAPYLLVLGSGPSMLLGSKAMRQVVQSVAQSQDLEQYYQTLDGFSAMERYVLLKKHFEDVSPSSGYQCVAQLVKEGFFNIIFTTNLDSFVEKSLEDEQAIEHQVLVCGDKPTAETLAQLENPDPPVKLVKLHGDIETRSFAFTPSEVSKFGTDSERVLREYLKQDLIIVGHGPRDYDINRAMEQQGGSIWYINEEPPPQDSPLSRAMHVRRTEANIIDGEFGLFDRFFEALCRELTK